MPILPVILVLISAFMHAGWNLAAHSQRANSRTLFLRIPIVVGVVGLGPALIAEFRGIPFPTQVWGLLALAGLFQGIYYLGLTMGYRSGDFSVVYPVGRALPVLFLAGVDLLRGRPPSAVGWLGILLVVIGCVLTPLESLRNFTATRYWNRTMVWILTLALGTVGYTTMDKMAAEMLPPGPLMAARYGVLEFVASIPYFWLMLILLREPIRDEMGLVHWKWAAIAAVFVLGAYWLVLWAYQLSPYASYIVALRQFSIVIGVTVGTFIFSEPAPLLRFSTASMIAVGVASIALAT